MRDGYMARWRGQEYEASPDGEQVRVYRPDPADGFDEVRPGRYVRVLPALEVDLSYVRTTCSWRGEPFIVLAGGLHATTRARLAGNHRPLRLGIGRTRTGEPCRLRGRRGGQVSRHRIGTVKIDPTS